MKKFGTAAAFMRHLQGMLRTEVFDSPISGKGLRTLEPAAAGQVVGFYGGRKFAGTQAWLDSGATDGRYLFSVGNGTVIDGKRSRFGRVNHSCDPNLAVVPVVLGLQAEILFLTQRPIAADPACALEHDSAHPLRCESDVTQWVRSSESERCLSVVRGSNPSI